MAEDRDGVNRIVLNGDLSMVGVTEQFPLLAQYLAKLATVATNDLEQNLSHEIDLIGLQALDACGCQLLAAFLRNLRQCGAGVLLKLSDDYRVKIHSLGFDNELLAGECA